MGKAGAFCFAKLMRTCTCLKSLDLSDNQIDFVGTGAVVAILTRNRYIQALDLSGNQLTAQDEKTLTSSLTANRFFHGEFDEVCARVPRRPSCCSLCCLGGTGLPSRSG